MPPELLTVFQAIFDAITLVVLLVGLVGLVVPVFPGLTIMWLGTLAYAIIQHSDGRMTGWDWLLFAVITLLMIVGNVADNLIIARRMRDKYIPWSSILLAFGAGIVASLFLTPIGGLIAAPLTLLAAEYNRLKDRGKAMDSTRAYMVAWGWAFAIRFIIGLAMIGLWMLWAWL